jgi:hypothetical protein
MAHASPTSRAVKKTTTDSSCGLTLFVVIDSTGQSVQAIIGFK